MGLEGDPNNAYAEELRAAARGAVRGFEPGKVHLLAGHLFVGGATVGGGERTLTIGDLFAVAPQGLPIDPAVHRARTRPPPAGRHRGRRARPATPARCCSSTSASASRTRASRSSTVDPGRPAKVEDRRSTRRPPAARRGRHARRAARDEGRPRRLPAGDAPLRGPSAGPRRRRARDPPRSRSRCRLDYERGSRARASRASMQRLEPRELFARYYQRPPRRARRRAADEACSTSCSRRSTGAAA